MDASTSDFPRRTASRPIQVSAFSLKDKFLGLSVSPASIQSLSSDTTDANDLDEQEIWGVETSLVGSTAAYVDGGKGQPSLPPRIVSAGRAGGSRSGTLESRSPLKDGSPSWASSAAVKGLSSISGLSPQINGVRSPTGRILGMEATSRRIPAASRMIPRVISQETNPRKGTSEDGSSRMVPQSAPVNIPDWSRFEKNRNENGLRARINDSEQEEEDEERLPPHEFLAREYARSQMTSSSVFEGAGRTLKGRDMSRVRNAVLSYTGFIE